MTDTTAQSLAALLENPEDASAWGALAERWGVRFEGARTSGRGDTLGPGEDTRILHACMMHEGRGENQAAARLLGLVACCHADAGGRRGAKKRLAQLAEEELFDARLAEIVWQELAADGDDAAEEALEALEAKRAKARELAARFEAESAGATSPALVASLLTRAAEVLLAHGRAAVASGEGGEGRAAAVEEEARLLLVQALAKFPGDARAARTLASIYGARGAAADEDMVLARLLEHGEASPAFAIGIARLATVRKRRGVTEDARLPLWQKVHEGDALHREALGELVASYTRSEEWDAVTAVYERQLVRLGAGASERDAVLLQLGMLHFRMRKDRTAASKYFGELRPRMGNHPAVMAFYAEAGETPQPPPAKGENREGRARIDELRAHLRKQPEDREARLELAALFEANGSFPQAVDALKGVLERTEDATGRAPLLERLRVLYRERVKNETARVAVLQELHRIEGDMDGLLAELRDTLLAMGRPRDALALDGQVAEKISDPVAKKRELVRIARTWVEQFQNAQAALETWEKVRAVDRTDIDALRALRELYTKRRLFAELFDLLGDELETVSGAERAAILLERGKLASERLDRSADAISAFRALLAEDPSHAQAREALERHAETHKDYELLLGLLEERAREADSPVVNRVAALTRIALLLGEKLERNDAAEVAWGRVLEIEPRNARALRVLREARLARGDWDGLTAILLAAGEGGPLVEAIVAASERASDVSDRLSLLRRVETLATEALHDDALAGRTRETILMLDPGAADVAARAFSQADREGRWSKLPGFIALLEGASAKAHADGGDVAAVDALLLPRLSTLVDVLLGDRRAEETVGVTDPVAAFDAAKRLLERAGGDAAFDRFVRAARAAGREETIIPAIDARIAQADSANVYELLLKKVALAGAIGQRRAAADGYLALLDADGAAKDGDRAAWIKALDGHLRGLDDRAGVRALFERRLAPAKTKEKLELLTEWANLEEGSFEELGRAADLQRRILELIPNHGGATRALARLLQEQGDLDAAVALLEKDRDAAEGADRAAREVAIAKTFVAGGRPQSALAAAKRALEVVSDDADALTVLEELLVVPETRGRAALILEEVHAANGNPEKRAAVLDVIIATAASRDDRARYMRTLAEVREGLNDVDGALDAWSRACAEQPSDLTGWDSFQAYAQSHRALPALVEALSAVVPKSGPSTVPEAVDSELADRLAAIHEEHFGDVEAARPYLERVFAKAPDNDRVFERLRQILSALGEWNVLLALFERAAESAADPDVRIERYSDAALVAEEIAEDPERAIALHEKALVGAPNHEPSLIALEKLYTRMEQWDRLAAVLDRRLVAAIGDDVPQLRRKLGLLRLRALKDARAALPLLALVLEDALDDQEVLDEVFALLANADLRRAAAAALEPCFVANGDATRLIAVLEARLETETEDEDEAETLLRRLLELKKDVVGDRLGALAVYAKLLPRVPADSEVREGYAALAAETDRLGEYAQTLARAAEPVSDKGLRVALLAELATLLARLGDDAGSEAAHREVVATDSEDPDHALPSFLALARSAAAAGKHDERREALARAVPLELDPERRRALRAELAELLEGTLSDQQAAVTVWEEQLAADDGDEGALAALDRLYASLGPAARRAEILVAREEHASTPEVRRESLFALAALQRGPLSLPGAAIETYRRIVDDFGPSREALVPLAGLQHDAGDFSAEVEVFEELLAVEDDVLARVEILRTVGELRAEKLDEPIAAVETYRDALALAPDHPGTRKALLLLVEDPVAARAAALVLQPLLESEGDSKELLSVLDVLSKDEDDPAEALVALAAAHGVASRLGAHETAFALAERGVYAAVSEESLPRWLERARESALALGTTMKDVSADGAESREPGEGSVRVLRLFRDVLSELPDETLRGELALEIGTRSAEELGDADAAREYLERALELRPADLAVLVPLEGVLAKLDAPGRLAEILEQRATAEYGEDARIAARLRLGALLEGALREPGRAIETFEAVLAERYEAAAFEGLERLFAAEERWGDLVTLLRGRIDSVDDAAEKAARGTAVAAVLADKTGDVDEAFEVLQAALAATPAVAEDAEIAPAGSALALLFAWADGNDRERALRAAEVLEGALRDRRRWDSVVRVLERRLVLATEGGDDLAVRRELLANTAQIHEFERHDPGAAFAAHAAALALDASAERPLEELERLAERAGEATDGRRGTPLDLAELLEKILSTRAEEDDVTVRLALRAATLFELASGGDNLSRALALNLRAHRAAPEGDVAFRAVDRLLFALGRHEERIGHQRDKLGRLAEDALAERVEILHLVATIEAKDLPADAREGLAVATWRTILEIAPADETAARALIDAYTAASDVDALAALHAHIATHGESLERRSQAHADRAAVLAGAGRIDDAIDALAAALDKDASPALCDDVSARLEAFAAAAETAEISPESPAARALEVLDAGYEARGMYTDLVRVFDARLTRVTPLDRDLATSLRRRKARAQEEQLHDAGAALTTLADAFAREPGDFEIRTLFEEKATALAAWDVLADTYEAALARAEGEDRRSLLVAAARVHDERRDDPRKALRAWSTVIEADAEDAQALEEAERLSTLLADWAIHVSVLEKLLKLAGNDDDRRSFALRIGEAKRDMLADPTGAAAAYEMALDLDPSSTYLQDACIELWESLGEGQKLLTVLPRRISAIEADDDSEYATTLRRDLSRLNAKLQLSENDDATAAAGILEGLVEAGGDDAETLEELANCYFALQKYEDVERVTLKRIEKLTTADARPARLSLAALRADMLGKPRDAFDGYRDLLNDGSFDDAVAEKLVALAEKNASLAEEAVSLTLSPLEGGTNYALFFRVAKLAERAFGTDDAGQDAHADLALRVAAVHERASDAEAAFDATMAALGRRSALASVRELASVRAAAAGGDALERLADRWLGLATDEMAFEAGPVGTETRALLRHLEGEIARDSLSAPERALVAFRAAADLHADGFGSLAALEALHASRNEFASAAAVAAERAKPEELDADMRAEHLFRAFTHEQNVSAEGAFGRLESVLAARATYLPALAALEAFAANDGGDGKALAARAFAKADRLFADAEDVARRVALHEARLARSLAAEEGGVLAALALAAVLADARKDPGAALDVLLARVSAEGALARSGSEVRERTLELAVAADRVGATVDLLGAAALAAADGDERREEALALARLVRDRFEDRRRAVAFFEAAGGLAIADDGVLSEQEALFEALAEPAALVATLRARAKLAAEPEALFVRALAVAGSLGDDADAVTEAIAREALERLTDAPFALDALAGVLERKRDFAGLVAVIERRAGVAAEDEKEALLLRAASTALRDVGSSDDAVRLFERAFKELASADAADALLGLYAARNAHRERADLLLVLAGAAHDEARRERLLEAVVTLEALGDSTVEERRALLAQILEDDATHARAEERLDALLVAHAETAAQVSFWEKRAKHHASIGEVGRSAAIAFARRAAAASEETLADTARALASLVIVESCGGADAALLTKIAHLAETTGDRATALRALDALAAEASGTEKSVLCIRLARLYTAAADVDAAQRSWEAALAADPEATEPPKALRAIYTQQGDRGRLAPLLEAIARLRLRNEPGAGEPHVGGSLLPTAGPAVEVVALFREAATAYGDDHESAARVLEAALAIVPESRDILGELADVELRRGRPEAAATALEKIIASYNGRRSKELAVVHQKLAEAFEAKGDPAGALVQYDASFRIEPGNIRVLRRIGELALESGDLDRAQRSFRALLLQKLDGSTAITKAEVFYFLGEILRRQGDAAKAKEMFQKALQADPAHEPTKAALASLA